MTHRILLGACVIALSFVSAPGARLGAQILRVPERDRATYPISVGFSVGYLQTQDRYDGQSGTSWLLGEAISYRAAIDHAIRAGALGIAASVASVPITRGNAGEGEIQLRQYLATFRSAETPGFFQVVEIGVGLAQWTGYSGPETLTDEDRKARNAPAMAIGYGLGFKLGERFAVTIVQDAGTLIGSKEGLSSGESRTVVQYTTRIGGRVKLYR